MSIEDDVRASRAQAAETWATMVANGSAEGDVLDIDAHFVADDPSVAERLAERLRETGALVTVDQHKVGILRRRTFWTVQGTISAAVSGPVVEDLDEAHLRLAAEVGAQYDGWGALLPAEP
jgi:hypothetical protein